MQITLSLIIGQTFETNYLIMGVYLFKVAIETLATYEVFSPANSLWYAYY